MLERPYVMGSARDDFVVRMRFFPKTYKLFYLLKNLFYLDHVGTLDIVTYGEGCWQVWPVLPPPASHVPVVMTVVTVMTAVTVVTVITVMTVMTAVTVLTVLTYVPVLKVMTLMGILASRPLTRQYISA